MMTLQRKYIKLFFVLLPFLLVFLAEAIQNFNKSLSTQLKLAALIYMLLYALLHKINKNLFTLLIILIVVMGMHLIHPYNWHAAVEEMLRYFFPLVVLLYGYSIRKWASTLILLFIYFVIINDLWQIINYINWIRGVDQWFYFHTPDGIPYYNATMGILRASGLVVFFSLFAFMNAVAYFLIYFYYHGKYRKWFLAITLISIFASFSYKTIGAFLFVLFLLYENKIKIISAFVVLLTLGTIMFPQKSSEIVQNIALRIRLYITEGNSVRAESYRMMAKHTKLFLGEGLGTFGGAASTKYHSPLYKQWHFNWYNTPWLATTDTYYPHLFIELGLVGALLYLLFLLYPIINRMSVQKQKIIYVIYFLLFFEGLFSFSINHLGYLMSSLIWIYPLYYLIKNDPETISVHE